MAKRKSVVAPGQIRKLRRVEPAAGEHGPVPVYLASRLEPAGQESSWQVQPTGKEPKVTCQLVGFRAIALLFIYEYMQLICCSPGASRCTWGQCTPASCAS